MGYLFHNYVNISFKQNDVNLYSPEIYSKIEELFDGEWGSIVEEFLENNIDFSVDDYDANGNKSINVFCLYSNLIHNKIYKIPNICRFKIPLNEKIKNRLSGIIDYNGHYKKPKYLCLYDVEYIIGLDTLYYDCLKLLKMDNKNDKNLEVTFAFADVESCENFKNNHLELIY